MEGRMELIEKPPKMKLSTTAKEFFNRYPGETMVGILTKEGRVFHFRRDPQTGEPVKVAQSDVDQAA